jgi:hypothetical protein
VAFSADAIFRPIHYFMLFRATNHECVVGIVVCIGSARHHMPLSRAPFIVLLFIYLFFDVDLDEFGVGVWKACLQIQDPSLLRLASLPKERLFQMLPDNPDFCYPVVRRIKHAHGGWKCVLIEKLVHYTF